MNLEVWKLKSNHLNFYIQQYEKLQDDLSKRLSGARAKLFFKKSHISQETLGNIWNLIDVTMDESLSLNEFIVAMHLIIMAKNGYEIPKNLPVSLTSNTIHNQLTKHLKEKSLTLANNPPDIKTAPDFESPGKKSQTLPPAFSVNNCHKFKGYPDDNQKPFANGKSETYEKIHLQSNDIKVLKGNQDSPKFANTTTKFPFVKKHMKSHSLHSTDQLILMNTNNTHHLYNFIPNPISKYERSSVPSATDFRCFVPTPLDNEEDNNHTDVQDLPNTIPKSSSNNFRDFHPENEEDSDDAFSSETKSEELDYHKPLIPADFFVDHFDNETEENNFNNNKNNNNNNDTYNNNNYKNESPNGANNGLEIASTMEANGQPCSILNVPPCPPRRQHGRSASLDLNKLFANAKIDTEAMLGFITKPPLISPKLLPTILQNGTSNDIIPSKNAQINHNNTNADHSISHSNNQLITQYEQLTRKLKLENVQLKEQNAKLIAFIRKLYP